MVLWLDSAIISADNFYSEEKCLSRTTTVFFMGRIAETKTLFDYFTWKFA